MPSYGQAPAPEKVPSPANSVAAPQPTFYSLQMARHGVFYWGLHAAVALAVAIAGAAVWDLLFLRFFK